jgi:hypothetical protein
MVTIKGEFLATMPPLTKVARRAYESDVAIEKQHDIVSDDIFSGPLLKGCVSYQPYFKKWTDTAEEAATEELKMLALHPREKYIMDPPKLVSGVSGEERFREFEWLLENAFAWKRHMFQKEFHERAAMVLAPQIIGDDWDKIGPPLVKERGWSMQRNSRMLLGMGPRRFGKSIAQSMLAAAYALVTPNSTQSIFSTAQRISIYLGELIRKAICDAGMEWRIKKFGEEKMEIYGPAGSDATDIRKIFYYPANAKIDTQCMCTTQPPSVSFKSLCIYFFFSRAVANSCCYSYFHCTNAFIYGIWIRYILTKKRNYGDPEFIIFCGSTGKVMKTICNGPPITLFNLVLILLSHEQLEFALSNSPYNTLYGVIVASWAPWP